MPASADAPETGALIYWFDIRPEVVVEWLDWYLRDHMPSRVGTSFTTGRCFEAIDASSSHMVLFETTRPEDLLAPDYLRLLGTVSPEDRQRRGWYANTVRMTARVGTRISRGIGSVLAVARFDQAPSGPHAVCDDTTLNALSAIPGVGSVWVAQHDRTIRERMDQVRVTGHQDQSADAALMIEAARDQDARDAIDRLRQTLASSASDPLDRVSFGRYRLMYAMTGGPR